MAEEFDERQYWPSKWSKRLPEEIICAVHAELATKETQKNKELILSEANVQYGNSKSQVMDIYGKNLPPDAPWFIYIHGGYWVEYTKDMSGYCAYPLWKAGVRVGVPDYDLAPKATMTEIVHQMLTMSEYILKRAETEGSCGVWICGHSAGAHLAARTLDEKWLNKLTENQKSLFKGVILIGGVYDLTPILKLDEVNDLLKMTVAESKRESPVNTITNFKGKSLVNPSFKTIIIVAENESEAFKKQSATYCKLLNEESMKAELLLLPELDHFDVVENLRDESYELTKRIIGEIKSAM